MRRISVVYTIISLFALSIAIQSCQKTNGIDNNQVITKPYSLYIVDSQGAIYNTNDGMDYKKLVFAPDGIAPRAIATSGNCLIMVKTDLFFSNNEGKQFNVGYPNVSAQAFHHSMVIDMPTFEDRIYAASNVTGAIAYSDSCGATNSWKLDQSGEISGSSITSFTQLQDGKLVAFDDLNRKIYVKNDLATGWTAAGTGGLPGAGTGRFFISHYGNTIVAADYSGNAGIWFSTDNGNSFNQYTGIPANVRIFSVHAPFEKVLLVGLEGKGILRLPLGSTTFEEANNGLSTNTSVHGMVSKSNRFKNKALKPYVYIATNNGIYRSEDNGENWIKMKDGNYSVIY